METTIRMKVSKLKVGDIIKHRNKMGRYDNLIIENIEDINFYSLPIIVQNIYLPETHLKVIRTIDEHSRDNIKIYIEPDDEVIIILYDNDNPNRMLGNKIDRLSKEIEKLKNKIDEMNKGKIE